MITARKPGFCSARTTFGATDMKSERHFEYARCRMVVLTGTDDTIQLGAFSAMR